jgi:hypothetical protein
MSERMDLSKIEIGIDEYEAARRDRERLDWLERTLHVVCYDGGQWFCAWRGGDGIGWVDRPCADTPRAAIDLAVALTGPAPDPRPLSEAPPEAAGTG